ncbi:Hypothetical protein FKW44_008031 [Caligus rogercresseyi]|uniref:Uncharacterized protein n=1 Tax=Caligus rogercresseyi TaxID=217165 RepID=A0A7T8KFM5_CALRO|nr:Hypothetical protein FKW44_008031 [Caligus rogercresseyi]
MVWAEVTSDGKRPQYLCRGGREDRPGSIPAFSFRGGRPMGTKRVSYGSFPVPTR